MATEVKRLYRSRKERMIGGVCGGLGVFLGLDPTVIRLIFVLLAIFGFGSAIIVYLILLLVVPEEPLPDSSITPAAPEEPPAEG